MMTSTKSREQLSRTLTQKELDALEPITEGEVDAVMSRAEDERNAARLPDQCSTLALNVRFQ